MSAASDHAAVMVKRRRTNQEIEAARRAAEQATALGRHVREARLRRGMTQAALARRVGLARSTVSAIELGRGAGHTLETWQWVAAALGQPLAIGFGRMPDESPADAGHLAIQELVLRLALRAGFERAFELPTRPADPSRSVDVVLRDERRRLLVLCECWNAFGDLGAAARSTSRKVAEADAMLAATGRGEAWHVRSVWIVRPTQRNRTLISRYPHVFATRFLGSSATWAQSLTGGCDPPVEPGLVWGDVGAQRIVAWRRPRQ